MRFKAISDNIFKIKKRDPKNLKEEESLIDDDD